MDTLTLTTPELRPGDIVLNHGMRILIEGPAHVYHGHGCDRTGMRGDGIACPLVYAWPGRVLNLDEVRAAGIIPRSFLYDKERDMHGPGHGREDYWSTQGNNLARWRVERSEPPASHGEH